MTKRIFISADHGMAIVYFLQSDVVSTLLDAGVEVVLLTDDETKDRIAERFARPGLTFEGLRLKQANAYAKKVRPRAQWLLAYLRRVGGSWRINNEAQDSHIWEVWAENTWKFRLGIWTACRAGDIDPALQQIRPQSIGQSPIPLHAKPGPVYRSIRQIPARSGGRFDTRLEN